MYSNLIYCFSGAISSSQRGTLTKIIYRKENRGVFKVSDPEIKEVAFEVFPERYDREAISYLEEEGVPQNWGVVTERIRKVFE